MVLNVLGFKIVVAAIVDKPVEWNNQWQPAFQTMSSLPFWHHIVLCWPVRKSENQAFQQVYALEGYFHSKRQKIDFKSLKLRNFLQLFTKSGHISYHCRAYSSGKLSELFLDVYCVWGTAAKRLNRTPVFSRSPKTRPRQRVTHWPFLFLKFTKNHTFIQ